jgi:hypothetical protein
MEEHWLSVFANRVLRKISGPNRDEMTREWRRLYNEELCYLYSSQNIIHLTKSNRIKWEGHVTRMGGRRVADLCTPDGKRSPRRPRRR